MIEVINFASGRFSAPVVGDVSSNNALRRNANGSGLQIEYNRLAVQLGSVTAECGTWC